MPTYIPKRCKEPNSIPPHLSRDAQQYRVRLPDRTPAEVEQHGGRRHVVGKSITCYHPDFRSAQIFAAFLHLLSPPSPFLHPFLITPKCPQVLSTLPLSSRASACVPILCWIVQDQLMPGIDPRDCCFRRPFHRGEGERRRREDPDARDCGRRQDL